METLTISVPVFIISSVVVVIAGVFLAKYGDEIAEQTGLGTLWVGTILISVATSFPEIVTNISAVIIGSPEIALGTVFGANAKNILTLAGIGAIFGVSGLFSNQDKQTQVLAAVAVLLGLLTLFLTLIGDLRVASSSFSGIVLAVAYVLGMKVVFSSIQKAEKQEDNLKGNASGRSPWIGFLAASVAIICSAPFLASSAEGIAGSSGLSASFVGVLLVAFVTTLPEATVAVAAALRRSPGLIIGNIFGSCAFNLFIIPISDLFDDKPLLLNVNSEHMLTLIGSVILMSAGYFALVFGARGQLNISRLINPLMIFFYIGLMYAVYNIK